MSIQTSHGKSSHVDGALPKHDSGAIVFSQGYDIQLPEIKRPVPFDFQKRGKIAQLLRDSVGESNWIDPVCPEIAVFERVHSKHYLREIDNPSRVATVMSTPELALYSRETLRAGLIDPLMRGALGTVATARAALKAGCAFNLSGGFHHAKVASGEGFCFVNDIALAAYELLTDKSAKQILIVDLDAHYGNGTADILRREARVHILDIFNGKLRYPVDPEALERIDRAVPVAWNISGNEYLNIVNEELTRALQAKKFDLAIFNAGVDVCSHDLLGQMKIAPRDVIARDELVARLLTAAEVPFAYVLSGGYGTHVPDLVSQCILAARAAHQALKSDKP